MKRILLVATLLASISLSSMAQKLPKLKPLGEKAMLETISPLEKKGRWGYANEAGKFIIKNVFEEATDFEGQVARVRINNKWGLISRNGVFLLEPAFDEIQSFGTKGYALVREANVWGTIDMEGKVLAPVKYDEIAMHTGFQVPITKLNGEYGALNSNGRVSVEPIYSALGEWQRGFAVVWRGTKQGAVNSIFKTLLQPEYDDIEAFGGQYLKVSKDNKEGIASLSGAFLTPPCYDALTPKPHNYVVSCLDGKYGLLKVAGSRAEEVIAPMLSQEPEVENFPLLCVAGGKVIYLEKDQHHVFEAPEGMLSEIDPRLSQPTEGDRFGTHKLSPLFTLYTINGHAAYLQGTSSKCLWAANEGLKRYAESPVSTEVITTPVKKEVYLRGKEDVETVYHTLTFDVNWPQAPRDPRFNIETLQHSLVEILEKAVIDLMYAEADEGSNIPSPGKCRTLDDVKTLFFSSKKGTELRSIPSSIDYSQSRSDGLYFNIEDVSGPKGSITCGLHYEYYGGGAHGDRVLSHFVLDAETGAQRHLSDLFTPQQRQKMLQIIRTRPLDEEGNRIDTDDFFDLNELEELPDNFYIDNGIIYFQFQTYEIGPYFVGSPVLGVRLSEVQ